MQCFITSWNTEKRVENMMLSGVFLTNFKVFHLVMKHVCLLKQKDFRWRNWGCKNEQFFLSDFLSTFFMNYLWLWELLTLNQGSKHHNKLNSLERRGYIRMHFLRLIYGSQNWALQCKGKNLLRLKESAFSNSWFYN